ncbi:hypothetical protein [Niallia sp. FSL R7-0271]|uniref:hypothetical protein n=1 Tax=Niallia sp. FSL R7-0271 TaxID=2921678 RepID=UPI0030FB942B
MRRDTSNRFQVALFLQSYNWQQERMKLTPIGESKTIYHNAVILPTRKKVQTTNI